MNRVLVLLLLPLSLFAEAEGSQVTTTAGWTFGTRDQPGTAEWATDETVFAGLTARWGGDLVLSGRLQTDFSQAPLTADDLIGEMALTWNLGSYAILTAGKQRLSWGTARVFSAVDSLEPPLDPLDPQAKPRGVTGVRAEVLPLDWLSVWFLALPAPRLDDAVVAAKLDILWDEADLSFGAVRSVSRPLVASGSAAVRDRRESPVFFADFARFFDRFGFYGEAQLRQGRHQEWLLDPPGAGSTVVADLGAARDWKLRATGGLQMEFPVWLNGTLRWLTEYHYNGDGLSSGEAEAFEAVWKQAHQSAPTQFVPASGLNVGGYRQHYLYSGLSGLPVTEKLSLGASAIAGIEGGLLLLSASASWQISPSLTAGLDYDHFGVWNGEPGRSELLFLSFRNRVNANLTAWY